MAQQLKAEILNAALENLVSKRQQLDAQISEVRRLLGETKNGTPSVPEQSTSRRIMSAAGRRAIAEAQRQRWAAKRGESTSEAKPKSTRPKRKLSAEGRRNIVAALKKRWAAKRAEANKTTPKRVAKKSPANRPQAKAA